MKSVKRRIEITIKKRPPPIIYLNFKDMIMINQFQKCIYIYFGYNNNTSYRNLLCSNLSVISNITMLFFAGTWIEDWLEGNYKTCYKFRFIVHIEVALHCYLQLEKILRKNLFKHVNRVEHRPKSINIIFNIKVEV